jgi:uncharacterized protein
MQQNVLISGGTGLVGTRLTALLQAQGYSVSYLSRTKTMIPNVKVYRWDIAKGYIEEGALENADHLVLLAGAGIADERWTTNRKKELLESRVEGIELLARELQSRSYNIKSCVAASGIGFYGANTDNEHLTEESVSGNDFIAHLTRSWEKSSQLIGNIGIRTAILRIGIILTNKGGALPKMSQTSRFGIGSALGSGKQWVSWVHIDDICGMIIDGLNNTAWNGVFNAVSPNPVTNDTFQRQICEVLERPYWLPNVPEIILKLMLGEMANLIIGGNYVLNHKIAKISDFEYQYPQLDKALEDLL